MTFAVASNGVVVVVTAGGAAQASEPTIVSFLPSSAPPASGLWMKLPDLKRFPVANEFDVARPVTVSVRLYQKSTAGTVYGVDGNRPVITGVCTFEKTSL